MVERYAAIKGLLEGLEKVVKAFTTSLLCHHDTLTATIDRVSAQAATGMVRGPRVSSLAPQKIASKQKLYLRPRQHLFFGSGTPLLPLSPSHTRQ